MDIATWKTDYGSIEKSQTSSETTLDSYKPCEFCDYLCSLHYHYNIQSRHRHYSQELREPILMLLMWNAPDVDSHFLLCLVRKSPSRVYLWSFVRA
jgi:hypothetical protein